MKERRRWQGIVLCVCVAAMLVFIFGTSDIGTWCLSTNCECWRRVTFMFFHGNLMHLGMNVLALLTVAFRMYVKGWKWLLGLGISMCYPTRLITAPVIGMSAWIYAMLGLMTMTQKNWQWALAVYVTTITISAMMPGMAWGIHAWSYGLGLIASVLTEPIWKVKNEE